MKLLVLSRAEVAKYRCDVPHVVISVTDPRAKRAFLPKNPLRREVLRLEFDDVGPGPVFAIAMSEDHARQVAEFVTKHADVEMFVIHCEAGISRSAGIAAALGLYFDRDDSQFYQDPHTGEGCPFYPNSHVKSLVMRALGEVP